MNEQFYETQLATINMLYGPYTLGLYLVDRHYGGPEEGGWYYDGGRLVDPVTPTLVGWDAADALRETWQARADEELNKGRPPISSVLSQGQYCAVIFEGYTAPEVFPQRRPHYE